MSWQDELRRLDEDMAAGRVSTDDYRRRYDELTTQGRDQRSDTAAPAETTTEAHAETNTQADTETAAKAETTADQNSPAEQPRSEVGASPFPPAFRWDNPSLNEPNETTQVIDPIRTGDRTGDAERTQVVRTSTQPPPGTAHDDFERTQVVQVTPPAPSPYEQPSYQGSSFPTGGGQVSWTPQESTPPWVSSDLPPIPEPNAGWMMQGPEFFEPEPAPSGAGRIVAIVAGVLILAGLAVGAFILLQPGGSVFATPSDTPTQQPPIAPPAPVEPPAPTSLVADLPGEVKDTSALQVASQLRELGYLDEQEIAVLPSTGTSKAAFALSEDNGTKLVILVVQDGDAAAARDQLADLQVQFDLKTISSMPAGVRASGDDNLATDKPVLRRAHYASGDYLVRVEASGIDAVAVQAFFQRILRSQLERLPANG